MVFKGVGALNGATPGGKPVEVKLRGELEFHGVKRAVEVPVTVELGKDGSARVRGTLTVSLDAHGVERPSLLIVKLEDACTIAIDLTLGRAGRPAPSCSPPCCSPPPPASRRRGR